MLHVAVDREGARAVPGKDFFPDCRLTANSGSHRLAVMDRITQSLKRDEAKFGASSSTKSR